LLVETAVQTFDLWWQQQSKPLITGRNGGQNMKKWRSALSANLDGTQRFRAPFLIAPLGVADSAQNGFEHHAYLSHQNACRLCRSHWKQKFVNYKMVAESGEKKNAQRHGPTVVAVD